MKRNLTILAVLALLLMSFAVAAYADDEVVLPTIEDGRINKFDIASPVAIFADYSYPYADDINMGVLERLEFWGITYEDHVEKVLDVSAAQLQAADNSAGSTVVAAANGYTLILEADGSLTVTGAGYTYNWTQAF